MKHSQRQSLETMTNRKSNLFTVKNKISTVKPTLIQSNAAAECSVTVRWHLSNALIISVFIMYIFDRISISLTHTFSIHVIRLW